VTAVSEAFDRRLVAVMFTDMVGYTALIQSDEQAAVEKRDRYVSALDRQHDAFGGTVVQRLGDGSMSMFASSLAAVRAAVAMQQELAAQDVAVRIGVHVGEVVVEPERLTGEAVNIASRIESFAVPGGVMLSDAAYAQLQNRNDVEVVPLGRFKLKNVGRPFELYAVVGDGLVVPDSATLEGKGDRAALRSNVPHAPTPLLGRAADLASLADLAREHRVVTIVGPGGVGKTRVVVELGRLLAPEFLDGVAFVPMAHVTEPVDVVPALAEALDVKEAEERTLGEGIATLIGDRKALLLLDNLEQIVDAAAPEVARLVERCPELRVVATSRAPLRIAAEREYPLAPLELDSAVALFCERAGLTEETSTVADICRRLDGLPLALELAAARLRLLTPDALLERLDHALDVLTSGQRDTPARQQTLRATIEWSHSLLDEREQQLFRRMAVFVGGCTVADLETVCTTALDDLESLVDKALVQADGGRFRMLQTIGEYARERLDASGEAAEIARKHAARYAKVAREIRDGVEGTRQLASVERGIAEEGNIQAALEALLSAGDAAAAEAGMQMCGDLIMYWHIRGKNLTARDHAAAFLAADTGRAATAGRAGALTTASLASWMLGQLEQANEESAEARRIAAEAGAERELCMASFLGALGLLTIDLEEGLRLTAEAIDRSRTAGYTWGEGFAETIDGILRAVAGDVETAQARFTHALDIQRRLGDEEGAGLSLGGLAQLAAARRELADALDLYRQSLAAFEACGDRAEEARILSEAAWAYLQHGDTALSRHTFFDSVQAYSDVASVRGVGLSLIGLAATEAVEGRHEQSVQIAAAAEVHAAEEGIVNVYSDETPGEEIVERARAALAADELERATETGRRLSIEEALDLARPAQATPA
jgi:predicted ATPase/class 3 adenylate cyclase